MPELNRKINPELLRKHNKWERIRTLIDDNEHKIIESFCNILPNETTKSWEQRKKSFIYHFINTLQDLITAQTKAIFRQGVRVECIDENKKESDLQFFLDNVVNSSQEIDFIEYLRTFIADNIKSFGTIFIIVDKPGQQVTNQLDEKQYNKPYLTVIDPLDVEDFQYDENNDLIFFKYVSQKLVLDKKTNEYVSKNIFCIWTKEEYIEKDNDAVLLKVNHGFGFVPVIIKPLYLSRPNHRIGSTSIEQTSRLIVNASNMFHLACYELEKHGSSLLMMHADSRSAANRDIDAEGNTQLKKQDKDSVLEWEGEKPPEYLLKELEVENLINMGEKYFKLAEENEKTQKSGSKLGTKGQTVVESGFSKIVERQPVENNLIALASCLEDIAKLILDVVAQISDIENDIVVEFNKDFDVRSISELYKDLELATKNKIEEVSPTAYKLLHKKIMDKQITDPEQIAIVKLEIDDYVKADEINDIDVDLYSKN